MRRDTQKHFDPQIVDHDMSEIFIEKIGVLNLGGKSIDEAKKYLPKFHSQLMKVAKTGIINKKTASRKISRITKKINSSKKK